AIGKTFGAYLYSLHRYGQVFLSDRQIAVRFVELSNSPPFKSKLTNRYTDIGELKRLTRTYLSRFFRREENNEDTTS
ncbi:MAG: hypothetical protein ACPLRS_03160, partial [Hydrogenobacter sp.]